MSNQLPSWPISGSIISNSVAIDRLSLIEQKITTNSFFPPGQYIFFLKNNSIWYKYKNPTSGWTNEVLYIGNASNQNTKFDLNGYPVTTYLKPNGSIHVDYYDASGNSKTNFLSPNGNTPTIIISPLDTYIFWAPLNYNNALNYSTALSNYSYIHSYAINLPANIVNMQIEPVPTNRFMFTFELDGFGQQKVVVAFTDSYSSNLVLDVPISVTFN